MNTFEIKDNDFLYNGKIFRIISGAIHYFRVVPEYWKDRLSKLKACGLNTVETYIAWNLHEPAPGEFCFDGIMDITRFIEIAGELDLKVIIRPSPYICAEWEFGGLPPWLLGDPGMRLRCFHKPFLDAVDRYFDRLFPELVPWLCSNDGPIIAMQIENEYGSYGNDRKYLRYLEKGIRKRGVDVLLFTSDGPTDSMLQGGTLPNILKTVNFGSKPEESFRKLREYQPSGPLMCMEFWDGWFDHWGEDHHIRIAEDVAANLDSILKSGASVNIYMFHGGTNFGFLNGANRNKTYEPTTTSYDYDAPLNEAGDLTEKYYAVRNVISKYMKLPEMSMPKPILKKQFGRIELTERASLFKALTFLSKESEHTCPVPMEMLGQNYGFILYRTHVSGPRDTAPLVIQDIHDRAQVFLNEKLLGIIERDSSEKEILVEFDQNGGRLDILVENMGRINYGPFLVDRKGITEGVRLGNQFLYNWKIFPLPLNNLYNLDFKDEVNKQGPAFYRGKFNIESIADTFLALPGWTKGVCFLNGFNLGRYWEKSPQKTLYIPAPLLHKGENELIVFELHETEKPVVELKDRPFFG